MCFYIPFNPVIITIYVPVMTTTVTVDNNLNLLNSSNATEYIPVRIAISVIEFLKYVNNSGVIANDLTKYARTK